MDTNGQHINYTGEGKYFFNEEANEWQKIESFAKAIEVIRSGGQMLVLKSWATMLHEGAF